MQYETQQLLTNQKALGYEISDYFSRFLSYLIDLMVIISIATLILVYICNQPAIIYLLPYYYLYTHNSIHRLVLNSNGLDFLLLFLLVSFIYQFVSSCFGSSPGGLVLNLRTKSLINYPKEDTRMSHSKLFAIKLKHSALRSIFLTLPFFPFFDNIFAKKGLKLTDRYLRIAVVYPLLLKKIKIKGLLNQNTDRAISKITPKMIFYSDFLEYYGLHSTKDNLEFRGGKRGRNSGVNWPGRSLDSNSHFDRISKVVNSKEFFLSSLEDNTGEDPDNKINSFYKVKKRFKFDYFYVACLLYFIPFIVAILVGWHITNGNTVYTPAPLISNRYVPSGSLFQVQQDIFNRNFTIDLHFLVLGGITMFFLPYLGIYSSVYLASVEIASSLHSQYWYYIIYAIFPHFFTETFGYVFGVIAGLYLSKLLIEIATSYSHGVDINVFLKHIYFNLSKFTLMLTLSVALILFASYIEVYITSFILNHFYFTHTKG